MGERDRNVVALHLLAGGLSGSLAKSSVAPLDRLKILYQVRTPSAGLSVLADRSPVLFFFLLLFHVVLTRRRRRR